MNRTKLAMAIAEAERFIERARDLPDGQWLSDFPKHTGAIRRASMDLTRALADLRKPN